MTTRVHIYKKQRAPEMSSSADAQICAICLDPIRKSKSHDVYKPCGHEFHIECSNSLSKTDKNVKCPCCRGTISYVARLLKVAEISNKAVADELDDKRKERERKRHIQKDKSIYLSHKKDLEIATRQFDKYQMLRNIHAIQCEEARRLFIERWGTPPESDD